MIDKYTKIPIYSLFLSILIQIGILILYHLFPDLPLVSLLCISGAAALLLRLNWIWAVFNIIVPFFAYRPFSFEVPPSFYLGAALLLAVFHLPAWWSQIPYYPTPKEVYDEISILLPSDRSFVFADIGCGVGKLLKHLSLQHPQGTFIGMEISLLPFLIAKMRNVSRPNVQISFQSFWRADLSCCDYLYAFLSPAPMAELWAKVEKEGKRGALFISNSFKAPVKELREKEVSPKPGGVLYIYNV